MDIRGEGGGGGTAELPPLRLPELKVRFEFVCFEFGVFFFQSLGYS